VDEDARTLSGPGTPGPGTGEPLPNVGPVNRERDRDAPAPREDGLSAFLYDADGEDNDVDPAAVDLTALAEKDLLWIDVDTARDDALKRVAALVPVTLQTLHSLPSDRPFVRDMGEAFVLGVLALPDRDDPGAASQALVCLVGRNWFVSLHRGGVGSLERFAEHLRGDSALGRLDAPSFLAQVLEWVLNAYFDRLDRLQEVIDDIEEEILAAHPRDETVDHLATLRRELGALRRRLSPHRQVFVTLAHPSFDVVSGSSAAAEFDVLADRLETALQTIDSTREMVFGSFDVVMSRAAQRTNEIMRVLTIVSVVLLPAGVIAGIFGMYGLPKFLQGQAAFWAALAIMAVTGLVLLLAARLLFWRR
jgi:Mg2+ and Co2+ transporter CorA